MIHLQEGQNMEVAASKALRGHFDNCLGINASEQALKPTIRHCRHLSIAEADGVFIEL
jgi:hypothetical protein